MSLAGAKVGHFTCRSGLFRFAAYTSSFSGFSNLSLASSVIGASNYFVVLNNDTTNKLIQVIIDNARFWSGATDGQWNTTVANWSPANFFVTGDKVIFQDTYPTNTANVAVVNSNIDLNATVTPGAVSFNNTAINYTLSGTGDITGTTGLNKSGTGGLTISNANTFSGNTVISGGYIEMQNAAALGNTTGSISVSAGATLRLNGGIAVGAKALSIEGSGVSSGGALRNVSGNNSYAGAVGLSGDVRINSDAGTLTLSGGITNNGNDITFGGAGNIIESGVIGDGAGKLIVDGTGTVTLSNMANTYSDQTLIKNGTLSVASIGSVGVAGGLGTASNALTGTIAIGDAGNTGTLQWTGSSSESTDRVVDLAGTTGGAVLDASGTGGAVLTLSSGITFSGAGSKTLTLTGNGGTVGTANVISGGIGDPSGGDHTSLLKTGTGVWRLEGSNTYSGDTTINGGTLLLGVADGLPTTAPTIANGSSSATLNLNGLNQTFNGLNFGGVGATSTAQGNVVIGATGKLTLGGDVTYSATGNPLGAIISGSVSGGDSAKLDLNGATRTFNVGQSSKSGGADLTIGAVITDAVTGGALLKTGAGTLVLTGTNTYAGVTTVDGGTLSVNPAALGATGTINIGTNGTSAALNLYADNAIATATLAADTNLNVGGTSSSGGLGFQLSGTTADKIRLSGSGVLTVGAGGGVINARALAALTTGTSYTLIDNTNITPTTITNFTLGVLTGGYTYALDNSTDGLLKLTVGVANTNPYYWKGATSGSWATLGGTGNVTNWGLSADGSGEAGATPGGVDVNFVVRTVNNINTTLDQPYSITGLFFDSSIAGAGNVTIAAGSGDGSLTIDSGGISVVLGSTSANITISAPVILGAGQSWNVNDIGQTLTVSGVVSGNSNLLTKTGMGTLVLSGVNTYDGGTTISSGTVQINSSASLGASSGAATLDNGVLELTGSNNSVITTRNFILGASGGTLTVDANNTYTINGILSNLTSAGKLTANGAGTLQLLGTNTYDGGTTISGGGIVQINADAGLGASGGSVSLDGGVLELTGSSNSVTTTRNFILGTSGGTLTVDATNTYKVDGDLISGGKLTANGAGTLQLFGSNTYDGGTTISGGGTVQINSDTSLGLSSGAATLNNGVLELTDSNNSVSTTRNFILGASGGTLTVDATNTYTINGILSNLTSGGKLTANGAGMLQLFSNNTYDGGTTISGGGTVQINSSTSLGASGGAATIKNATLQVTQDVVSTRNFLLESYGSKFLVDAGKSYTVSGSLSDGAQAGTLNKIGSGTMILSSGNTYSGGTFLTAGTLLANNSSGSATGSGAVSVTGSGTVFGGTGSVSGMVTIGSGAILAPGVAAGTLTVGSLTLASGSLLNFELGPIASSDKAVVATANGFVANGGTFTFSPLSGFTSGTYNLITYSGLLGGSFSNLALASSTVTDLSGNAYFVKLANNAGSVDLMATNTLIWNGNISGSIWDNGTTANTNWQSGATTNINFYNTMVATFDDTATNFTVNLLGTVAPSSITVNAANDYIFQGSGLIGGTTGLTKSGAGRLTIDTANTFSGNIAMNGGEVEMKDPAALGTTGTITISPGASLRLNNDGSGDIALGSRIVSIGGGGAIYNVAGNNSATLPGALTAATSFIADAGLLTLAGNITGSSLALSLIGNGGSFALTGTSINIANANFTSNMTGGTATVTNTIAVGTSALILNGTGTTILNGAVTSTSTGSGVQVANSGTNTFNANVSVTGAAGGISITGSGLTTFGTGTTVTSNTGGIVLSGSGTTNFNGTSINTTSGGVTVSGAASATFAATETINSGSGAWTISSTGNTTVNGAITGSGALTKTGAGTLTLAAVNTTYSGAVSLAAASGQNSGIILATANNALGTNAVTATFAAGATRAQLQLSGDITLGNSSFTTFGAGSDGTVDGIIRSVSGANIITGSMTMATGGTVNGVTLRADTGASLALNGAITASTAGRYLSLVGGGNFSFGSAGSINDSGANTVGLWVTNSGTTTLSSIANTYTLATAIGNGSTLIVADLSDGGSSSSIGASAVANTNLVIDNGTLKYSGSGAQSTNRLFSIGNGGATLDASGVTASDTLSFTGVTALGFNGISGFGTSALETGTRTLTLTGTNTGANTLAAIIGDQAAVTGATNLVKNGTGTWVLSGTNTFTGKTIINAGTLVISAENNLGATPGSTSAQQLTLNGGTLRTTATLTISSNRGVTVDGSGGTFETAASTTVTVNSVITGGGPITKMGAGTLVFTAANTYVGKTSIQNGALSVGSLNSVSGGTASSSLGAPATVVDGTIALGAGATGGTLIYTGSGETTDRVVDLAGTTGGGTLDQSGTGLLKITSDLTATGAGAKVLTLQGSSTGTGEISGAIVDNSTNTTSVVKSGTGTWVLSGNNTYTGKTSVTGGTLSISTDQNLGDAPLAPVSDQLTLNGGTLQATDTFTLLANRGVTLGSNDGTLNVDSGKTLTVGGVVSGATDADLTKSGAGTVILSGANAYAGKTSVTGGTLSISADNNLGAAPVAPVSDQLTLNGGALQATDTFTLLANRGVTLGANDATLNVDSGKTLTVAGVVDGATGADLTKSGAGTTVLSGANTYAGKTSVTGGTLSISADNNLGAAPLAPVSDQLTLNGGTLQATDTFTLLANRGVTLGANDATISVDSGKTLTVAGVVDGAAGADLTKTGSGAMIVTAANTYTGATTVNAGTLQVSDGTSGGLGATAVTVAGSSGTLTGAPVLSGGAGSDINVNTVGNIGGAVTLGTDASHVGILALGLGNTNDSNQTLTIGGGLTINEGSQVQFSISNRTEQLGVNDLNALTSALQTGSYTTVADLFSGGELAAYKGTLPASYGDYDRLSVTGGISVNADSSTNALFKIVNKTTGAYTTGTPAVGDVFNLADWTAVGGMTFTGTNTALSAANFDLSSLSWNGDLAFDTSAFATYGIIVVVPEPSRVLLLMFGMLGLMIRRRRRSLR